MNKLQSILTDLDNDEITKHQAYDLIRELLIAFICNSKTVSVEKYKMYYSYKVDEFLKNM